MIFEVDTINMHMHQIIVLYSVTLKSEMHELRFCIF